MSEQLPCSLMIEKKHNTYRLVNLSRAPWDFVKIEASDVIELRVKGLPTYLVHDSHEELNSLCFYLFLIFFYNPNQFVNKILITGNSFWSKIPNFLELWEEKYARW